MLQTILKDSFNIKKEFKRIIVLNDGGCAPCNKRFSHFLESKINSNTLFVVGATGTQFKINYLDSVKKNNIVFDYSNILEKQGILNNSGLILIDNKKIDTIITLEAQNIEKQLAYIEGKLQN